MRLNVSQAAGIFIPLVAVVWIAQGQGPVFRSNTREVSVVFRVTDKSSRPVAGLTRNEIHIEDEGVPRAITSFAGDVAYAQVVVAADVSGSMSTVLEPLQAALCNFADHISEDSDRERGGVLLSLLPFSDTATMLVDRTPNPREFKDAVARLRPSGSTALIDAILATVLNAFGDKAAPVPPPVTKTAQNDNSPIPSEFRRKPPLPAGGATKRSKFLIIFTDAGENSSMHQWSDIAAALLGKEVMIYSVLFDSGTPDSNVPKMSAITRDSGGRVYRSKANDLRQIYEQIAKDIRGHYSLTFAATDVDNPRLWRNIRVSTTRPGLTIFARTGYCPETPCQKADGSFIGGNPKNWNEVMALNRGSNTVSSVRQHLEALRFSYSGETEKIVSDLRAHPMLVEKRWASSGRSERPVFVAQSAAGANSSVSVDSEVCGISMASPAVPAGDRTDTPQLKVFDPEIRISRRPGASGQAGSNDDTYFQSQAVFYLADVSGRIPSRIRVQCNRPHYLVGDGLVQLAVQALAEGLKLKAENPDAIPSSSVSAESASLPAVSRLR